MMRLTFLLLVVIPGFAQNAADWPTYNRDLASSRYSPLTEINPGNVEKLTQAWSYKMRPDPTAQPRQQ